MASSSGFQPAVTSAGHLSPSPLVAELGFDGPHGGFMLSSPSSGRYWHILGSVTECLFGHILRAVEVMRSPFTGGWGQVQGEFAIKRMSLARISRTHGSVNEDPFKEISALQYLKVVGQHPNVIEATEVLQDVDNLYVVLPFCHGGELFRVVESQGRLCEAEAKAMFRDLLSGLAFLHSLDICHRDVSLENVLLTRERRATIIDLGMALMLPRDPRSGRLSPIALNGPCGKKRYMAPEVAMDKPVFDGFALDVWACGVILFILITGVPPFQIPIPAEDPRCRLIAVEKDLLVLMRGWNMPVSAEAADVIQSCLSYDPDERPTVHDLLRHSWLADR